MRGTRLLVALAVLAVASFAQDKTKPNILIIWGDDIGWFNVSAYNHGMMGYRTPNIDRIAKEGAMFTDWYGQQSCTAGRAAFMIGQSPLRTGLLKVGLPGAKEGISEKDVTIAALLKNHGYMTGQFGKNHLGDLDSHLPTNHGMDEFFGNLYHLNAEQEPENPDYPKNPDFKKKFGPRGVIHSTADGKIEDTGPLTMKRMETVDEEVTKRALDFMDRATKAKKPFFLWWNSTRMHVWTHLKKASKGKTGLGIYPDGMVEHDGHVGQLLKKLEELGIADNTIVMYSSDNGAEKFTWPDGGTTPFRGEKNSNWDGGYRVPCMIRWPGVIKPGTIVNDVCSHGKAAEGRRQGDRPHLQEPPRRLQPHARAERRDQGMAAQGVLLLDRRRQPRLPALQPLEARLPGAAQGWHGNLGEPAHRASVAEAVLPAQRPVRDRGSRGHRVWPLAVRSYLRAGARPGHRRQLAQDPEGVPAAPEARQLQPDPGDGEAPRRRQRRIEVASRRCPHANPSST